MILVLNKADLGKSEKILEWMKDYNKFLVKLGFPSTNIKGCTSRGEELSLKFDPLIVSYSWGIL